MFHFLFFPLLMRGNKLLESYHVRLFLLYHPIPKILLFIARLNASNQLCKYPYYFPLPSSSACTTLPARHTPLHLPNSLSRSLFRLHLLLTSALISIKPSSLDSKIFPLISHGAPHYVIHSSPGLGLILVRVFESYSHSQSQTIQGRSHYCG